ncbi:MAG: outer membrane protein assembly factor BamE, partial [Betaproteobacteria bacterium]|nr:outer membrane protein assembly factor BamE [Betaproteobacteria bacterium]
MRSRGPVALSPMLLRLCVFEVICQLALPNPQCGAGADGRGTPVARVPGGAARVFRYHNGFSRHRDAASAMSIKHFRLVYRSRPVVAALVLLALSACAYVPRATPYRMEIQQGNMVDQEMVSKLTPGMTREQVRFILGTPLVVDPFRVDRWDYVFLRQPENKQEVEKRRVVVYFENNRLMSRLFS